VGKKKVRLGMLYEYARRYVQNGRMGRAGPAELTSGSSSKFTAGAIVAADIETIGSENRFLFPYLR
jgi:hypothetical protein